MVTCRRRPRFNLGVSPLRGGSFSPRPLGGSPPGASTAAHGTPGNRPPAVPAVSRCRARQHHDQAVKVTPSALGAMKMSQRADRNAAHCPGRPLQRQGHPKSVSNRFAETIFRTHP